MTRKPLLIGGLAAVAALAGGNFVRTAPIDPAAWHADPAEAVRSGKPNDYLVAEGGDRAPPRFSARPAAVASAFDAVAMAEPGVTRLAGDPAEAHVSYVQRSRIVGFPDIVSARAVADGDGARLLVWSRSRYGHSDMGVNRARVEAWLARVGDRL